MIISRNDINLARTQAQANANLFQEPWMIFTDTSGNLRVEKYSFNHCGGVEICYPQPQSTYHQEQP